MTSGTLQLPQSHGHRHAPLRPFPPSLPLQAKNPGPEEPPEARPQLSPWVSPFLCWQIRPALSLRHNPNPKPDPNPNANPSPGVCPYVRPPKLDPQHLPNGGPMSCTPSLQLIPGGNPALKKCAEPDERENPASLPEATRTSGAPGDQEPRGTERPQLRQRAGSPQRRQLGAAMHWRTHPNPRLGRQVFVSRGLAA